MVNDGPRVMIFPVTMTCNSRCRSCGIWKLPESAKDHSSSVLLDRIVRDPFLSGHVESVNLSGGEPFLHPNLDDFMLDLLARWPHVREICVNTDGHLLPEIESSLERLLPECEQRNVRFRIYISLDGLGEAHDQHRRHPGAFERADLALRTLARRQAEEPGALRTTASFTMTDENVDQIVPVFEYVKALDLRVDYNLAARPEVFIGGAGLQRRFQVDPEQVERVRSAIDHVCAWPAHSNFSRAFYATMLETLASGRRQRGCFFPSKGFVLMPDGKLYVCGTYLDFYFGDLLQTDFETAWNGPQRKACRSEKIPAKCETCFSNSYEDWDLAVGAIV